MSVWQSARATFTQLGPVGVVAVCAGVAAVGIACVSLSSFVSAAMTRAPDVNTEGLASTSGEAQKAQFDKYLAQINGRSLFIVPGRPPAPEPEPPPPGPPSEPPKPTSYGGSDIIAIVLDTVWFEDGRRMRVGDEAKSETEVIEVHAPWNAVLRWKGERFTVPLFGRDAVVLKKDGKTAEPTRSMSNETDEVPPPPKPAATATAAPIPPPAVEPEAEPEPPPGDTPDGPPEQPPGDTPNGQPTKNTTT